MTQATERTAQQILDVIRGYRSGHMPQALDRTLEQVRDALTARFALPTAPLPALQGIARTAKPFQEASAMQEGGSICIIDDFVRPTETWRALNDIALVVSGGANHLLATITMWIDDEATPTVDAVPLTEFFGDVNDTQDASHEVNRTWIGAPVKLNDATGVSYRRKFRYGIPYRQHLRAVVTNPAASGLTTMSLWSQSQCVVLDYAPTKFWRFSRVDDTFAAHEYVDLLPVVNEPGELEALMLGVRSTSSISYLEGNFIAQFDGDYAIRSTGTEDLFAMGFYFGLVRHVDQDDDIVPFVDNAGVPNFDATMIKRFEAGAYRWASSGRVQWQVGDSNVSLAAGAAVKSWVSYYVDTPSAVGTLPTEQGGVSIFDDDFQRADGPLGNGWDQLYPGTASYVIDANTAYRADAADAENRTWQSGLGTVQDVTVIAKSTVISRNTAGQLFISANGQTGDPYLDQRWNIFTNGIAGVGAVGMWRDTGATAQYYSCVEDIENALGTYIWYALRVIDLGGGNTRCLGYYAFDGCDLDAGGLPMWYEWHLLNDYTDAFNTSGVVGFGSIQAESRVARFVVLDSSAVPAPPLAA